MAYQNNLLVPDDGTDLGFKRVTATAEYALGETRFNKTGDKYRYVEFDGAVTYVAGHITVPRDVTWTKVSNDVSTGLSTTAFAGVCMGVPTSTLKYGWVQIGGVATVVGNGSVAAGNSVKVSGTDGEAVAITGTGTDEQLTFGVALEADSGSPAVFKCLLNSR